MKFNKNVSYLIVLLVLFFPVKGFTQSNLKKVRLTIPNLHALFLPFYVASHKGFYRDEGIDLELILMTTAPSTMGLLAGDVDYSGAVTGVIGAAVQGRPLKVLLVTTYRPLFYFMARKEIREPSQLKGKKIAAGTLGGTGRLLLTEALKHFRLDPEKDVAIVPGSRAGQTSFGTLLSGVVDAAILSVPDNIYALQNGFNELLFLGDVVEFPQQGFGASIKKIQENPEEVSKVVRATLRGLQYVWISKNEDEVLGILMKQLRVTNRQHASEMFKYVKQALTKDGSVKPAGIQVLIDLARESSKIPRQFSFGDVVEYGFAEKASKQLGMKP